MPLRFRRTAQSRAIELMEVARIPEVAGPLWVDDLPAPAADDRATASRPAGVGQHLGLVGEVGSARVLDVEHRQAGRPGGLAELDAVAEHTAVLEPLLALRVVDGLVSQLATPWEDLARVPLTVGGFDTSTDDAQLASASEPTLVLVLELRLGDTSAPWRPEAGGVTIDLPPDAAGRTLRLFLAG